MSQLDKQGIYKRITTADHWRKQLLSHELFVWASYHHDFKCCSDNPKHQKRTFHLFYSAN